jgi:hypothetical protein
MLDGFDQYDRAQAKSLALAWTLPRLVDSVEWFGSVADQCRVLLALRDLGEPKALSLLAENPGIPDRHGQFDYVGYKVGSEAGVLNINWLLERKDGRWFTLGVALSDPDKEFDRVRSFYVADAVRTIVGGPLGAMPTDVH